MSLVDHLERKLKSLEGKSLDSHGLGILEIIKNNFGIIEYNTDYNRIQTYIDELDKHLKKDDDVTFLKM